MVLSEDSGNFKFGTTKLPDEAKAQIDELVAKLLADPKGAYFEIEGHTDNVGDKAVNQKLGMERAETVKKYLYEQYKIPLHRMNVISYGEEKPAADNKTQAKAARRTAASSFACWCRRPTTGTVNGELGNEGAGGSRSSPVPVVSVRFTVASSVHFPGLAFSTPTCISRLVKSYSRRSTAIFPSRNSNTSTP